MLVELAVRDLGVIEDLRLVLGPGMTALTGETGAGKTLVVDAIELLVGGRADPVLVRAGAREAWVEGRFLTDMSAFDDGPTGAGELEGEVVLARVIPADGRSRAYVNGRLATIGALAEWGARLVDLHGQHAHQSLLSPAVQRDALDRFAAVDLGPLRAARGRRAGHRRGAGRARRRPAGPGPGDRPAAVPGRRAGRRRPSTVPTRTSGWRPRRPSSPTPWPTGRPPRARSPP